VSAGDTQGQQRLSEAAQVAYRSGAIAILRAPRADRFAAIAEALVAAGITALEFTLTSEGALEALSQCAGGMPDHVALGAGTVLDGEAADACIDAGARFLVTPSLAPDVVERAWERGVPTFPGALTPTEVLSAWRSGAAGVKLFPAAAVGPAYVQQLAGPMPDVPLVPTGGVRIEDAGAWIRAGAAAVGVGGPLIGDAAEHGSLRSLEERARRLLDAIAEARPGQALTAATVR
jgi:2-dehydro-3-deoxyphosphogluconate aldolase/(4S)-4-hydroxy-2-oxoglutarate aldolase